MGSRMEMGEAWFWMRKGELWFGLCNVPPTQIFLSFWT